MAERKNDQKPVEDKDTNPRVVARRRAAEAEKREQADQAPAQPSQAGAPAEGSATPPEQPATPPHQPATPPSDGEKSPDERVALSKATEGDASAPGEVKFAPVTKYVLEEKVPVRAGGHILTERGWEIDPDATATPDDAPAETEKKG